MAMERLDLVKVLAMDKVVNHMNRQYQSGKLAVHSRQQLDPQGWERGFGKRQILLQGNYHLKKLRISIIIISSTGGEV